MKRTKSNVSTNIDAYGIDKSNLEGNALAIARKFFGPDSNLEVVQDYTADYWPESKPEEPWLAMVKVRERRDKPSIDADGLVELVKSLGLRLDYTVEHVLDAMAARDRAADQEDTVHSLKCMARGLGREAGKSGAQWVFDGNTTTETYRAVLKGIEDGDPEVLDAYNAPSLTGEFPTHRMAGLPHALGVPSNYNGLASLVTEWESAASEAFWNELERLARAGASS